MNFEIVTNVSSGSGYLRLQKARSRARNVLGFNVLEFLEQLGEICAVSGRLRSPTPVFRYSPPSSKTVRSRIDVNDSDKCYPGYVRVNITDSLHLYGSLTRKFFKTDAKPGRFSEYRY